MSRDKLKFARDVAADEWSALPRSFQKGEEVTRFRGHTYGLDRDDAWLGHRENVPIEHPGDPGRFFTCSVEFLVDEEGEPPAGDYLTPELARLASGGDRRQKNKLIMGQIPHIMAEWKGEIPRRIRYLIIWEMMRWPIASGF